jgi:pimeloyl-ACP methyl ester carboxylesterase
MGFLPDELLPSLATRYPIALKARHTLIGNSSGGHFALRALYDAASPFRGYVCISPGFGSAEGIQKAEAEYAAAHDDLDADLFICCGQNGDRPGTRRGDAPIRKRVHLDRRAVRDPTMARRPNRLGDHESRGPYFDPTPGCRCGSAVGSSSAPGVQSRSSRRPVRRCSRRCRAGARGRAQFGTAAHQARNVSQCFEKSTK